uniref:Uncharacterized protein n=1 Tax=Phyllostachys edulis TaxID=38705 RepID=D3IVK2_PHYED|nr:hypothetical protein [Phyllostachys edulis]
MAAAICGGDHWRRRNRSAKGGGRRWRRRAESQATIIQAQNSKRAFVDWNTRHKVTRSVLRGSYRGSEGHGEDIFRCTGRPEAERTKRRRCWRARGLRMVCAPRRGRRGESGGAKGMVRGASTAENDDEDGQRRLRRKRLRAVALAAAPRAPRAAGPKLLKRFLESQILGCYNPGQYLSDYFTKEAVMQTWTGEMYGYAVAGHFTSHPTWEQ